MSKSNKLIQFGAASLVMAALAACNSIDPWGDSNNGGVSNGGSLTSSSVSGGSVSGTDSADDITPTFDSTISKWDGTTASDASSDAVGSDKDFYHEANEFTSTVDIVYNGSSASVSSTNTKIITSVSGAYVTVDFQTNSVSGVAINISGTSEDGGLKIYGSNKFKLTLNGVNLTSKKGPAINSQCHKRIFVVLPAGTTNYLTDCATYTDDPYYISGSNSSSEDRKGCFFSEGNLIFSGSGVLSVAGKYKHGIVTDGYYYQRPGVTVVVTEAAKNGIHVKGDSDDNIGTYIAGGLIYTNISSTAGKGIKCDMQIEVAGGQLLLNTSGNAYYDSDEKDTSSCAGLKSDTDITISGGTHVMKATGTGGKGIKADGVFNCIGGTTTITTTGGKYTYTSSLTSSPKGVKADGNINISGGALNISVTGKNDGAEGLESKATMTISGGSVYIYAYDDAINASKALNITGGRVYAYAVNNDGIDSNGSLTISGGIVSSSATSSPESPIDCDSSNNFKINGGTIVGMGGTMQTNPSSSSSQRCVTVGGLSISANAIIAVLDGDGKPILAYKCPRTLSGATFFFSSSQLNSSTTYTISAGGKLTGYTESWNGYYGGGTWSDGTTIATFTCSSIITTVGSSSGMGSMGNMGGGMRW